MHDPMTVAHEIYLGKKKRKSGSYRSPLLTIWHVDPEVRGDDDSCGWFMRERHGDKTMLKSIRSAIESDFDRTYVSDSGTLYLTGFFNPVTGSPVMSVHGIALCMFSSAVWQFYKFNRGKHSKFMKKHLYDILHFSENPTDSLYSEITGMFRIGTGTKWNRESALDHYASIIYGWILRKNRKWYKHPRWHIHHWKIQFHPIQRLIRRYWTKCDVCGKRGFKGSAHSDWNGTKIWHSHCDSHIKTPHP